MFKKQKDNNAWAVGGGTLIGLGLGFFFLETSPLLFVGSLMLGIGSGIIASGLMSRKK